MLSQTQVLYLNKKVHDEKNFKCRLFSLPLQKIENKSEDPSKSEFPIMLDLVTKYVPDLIFIQFEPMTYLQRQRIFSYKCYLKEVGETHESSKIEGLNEPYPLSYEEAIINPV